MNSISTKFPSVWNLKNPNHVAVFSRLQEISENLGIKEAKSIYSLINGSTFQNRYRIEEFKSFLQILYRKLASHGVKMPEVRLQSIKDSDEVTEESNKGYASINARTLLNKIHSACRDSGKKSIHKSNQVIDYLTGKLIEIITENEFHIRDGHYNISIVLDNDSIIMSCPEINLEYIKSLEKWNIVYQQLNILLVAVSQKSSESLKSDISLDSLYLQLKDLDLKRKKLMYEVGKIEDDRNNVLMKIDELLTNEVMK